MPVAISIAVARYLAISVPAAIAVIPYCAWIIAPAVVAVVIIPYCTRVVAPARIIAQTRIVRPPPFPIFPLALAVQPVVLNVVVIPLCQPLAIGIVVIIAAVVGASIRTSVIRARVVPVLGAPGKSQ
jgi:hypothetical protein